MKQAIQEVSRALRQLHKALVDVARNDYERQHGFVEGPGHLLQLLTKEAEFAWLRTLSEAMVDIDHLADSADVDAEELRVSVKYVDELIADPHAGDSAFAQRYAQAMNDPAVIMAHAHARQAIAACR